VSCVSSSCFLIGGSVVDLGASWFCVAIVLSLFASLEPPVSEQVIIPSWFDSSKSPGLE
jgi:hypothetical protein